jgi:hypothetical protein
MLSSSLLSSYNSECTKLSPWPESASEIYKPRDSQLSAKLVSNLRMEGDPCRRILGLYTGDATCDLHSRG